MHSVTKEYADQSMISLEKNQVKFSGAAEVVGKLYRTRQRKQSNITEAEEAGENFFIECGSEVPKSKFCDGYGTEQP